MTIFRLYSENGNRPGFWVQHRSWDGVCAQVRSVDRGSIVMHTFDVRSGRPLPLVAPADDPQDKHYARIAEPSWSPQRTR
jgi:hypothetical protein